MDASTRAAANEGRQRAGSAATSMNCRPGCGACCIAPSISGPIPGMPMGKPAGVRCVQLTADARCAIFDRSDRPACCSGLKPSLEMCGDSREYAMRWLRELETSTCPPTASTRAREAAPRPSRR